MTTKSDFDFSLSSIDIFPRLIIFLTITGYIINQISTIHCYFAHYWSKQSFGSNKCCLSNICLLQGRQHSVVLQLLSNKCLILVQKNLTVSVINKGTVLKNNFRKYRISCFALIKVFLWNK